MCELPLIAIESPLACDPGAARKLFDAPGELIGLWPGVEWVRPEGVAFRVRQRVAFPFWEPLTLEFTVRSETAPRDRRQRYAIWNADGWFFDRAVLWKLRVGRDGVALNFASQHALGRPRLDEAVNAYRSRAIWPMRHDADAILERLVASFMYDHLAALDRDYVERVAAWLAAPRDARSTSRTGRGARPRRSAGAAG